MGRPVSQGGLDQFEDQRFINLETYRKSGEGVRTPVWFVIDGGMLFFRTPSSTGKVRRLRREKRVRVAPCARRGEPTGRWIRGEARFVEGEQARRVNELLNRKYGLYKRLVDKIFELRGNRYITVGITPQGQQ